MMKPVRLWRNAWGFPLENRSFTSGSVDKKYQFTGKERDKESGLGMNDGYDYFGARYYDSRIGRWGQCEPLLNKYVNITPYCYSIDNPIILSDPNGKDPRRDQLGTRQGIIDLLNENKGRSIVAFSFDLKDNENRYIYTQEHGFLDLIHMFYAASLSGNSYNLSGNSDEAFKLAVAMGEAVEAFENYDQHKSAYDPEDPASNVSGAEFGLELNFKESNFITDGFIEKFTEYMDGLKIVDKDDESIARDKLFIPEDKHDNRLLPSRHIKYIGKGQPCFYCPYRGEDPNYGN